MRLSQVQHLLRLLQHKFDGHATKSLRGPPVYTTGIVCMVCNIVPLARLARPLMQQHFGLGVFVCQVWQHAPIVAGQFGASR